MTFFRVSPILFVLAWFLGVFICGVFIRREDEPLRRDGCVDFRGCLHIRHSVLRAEEVNEMAEELKPCPFCGGEAEFIECGDGLKPSIQDCWRIACGNLRCGVTDGENFTFVRRAEAIAGWNNQFVPEALQAEIDRLTAENADLMDVVVRLASSEAFTTPFYNRKSSPAERELDARIRFADSAVKEQTDEDG